MARIYLALALFAMLLLASNLLFALAWGDFGETSRQHAAARQRLDQVLQAADVRLEDVAQQRQQLEATGLELRRQRDGFWPHIWLGIIASLVSLLVNSISVTYFIGTSRWCREVSDAYGMDGQLARRSQQLKRRSFPWALAGILITLAIAGLGAAADPYSSVSNPSAWVNWHWMVALSGILVIGVSFLVQAQAVAENYETIQSVLKEAERIRADRQPHPEYEPVTSG